MSYNIVQDATDAGLLADAMQYIALNKEAQNEAYNVTNGDVFRWKQVGLQAQSHPNTL